MKKRQSTYTNTKMIEMLALFEKDFGAGPVAPRIKVSLGGCNKTISNRVEYWQENS